MVLASESAPFPPGIFHLMSPCLLQSAALPRCWQRHSRHGRRARHDPHGGLSKKIRWTYLTMLTATLAIAGFPPLAGFFSKDSILLNAYQSEHGGRTLYAFGLLTATTASESLAR